ncbi:hypothetical protein SLEP1_g23476 [Rubroshorea leprosula]|uniref:Uncharacterized protein n=1 Tax=Rubroshorea leprosula TaxID=152421 RepID=A0AAV5JNG3_9ROSI|nr:hypothetical protein SLEP1_g23476 [Rubroshorea leprosula]
MSTGFRAARECFLVPIPANGRDGDPREDFLRGVDFVPIPVPHGDPLQQAEGSPAQCSLASRGGPAQYSAASRGESGTGADLQAAANSFDSSSRSRSVTAPAAYL